MSAANRLKKLAKGAAELWHGSAHRFDKFDAAHIGSGEGNQAFGHGLYFAGEPEVARAYRKMLADPRINARNVLADNQLSSSDSAVSALQELGTFVRNKELPLDRATTLLGHRLGRDAGAAERLKRALRDYAGLREFGHLYHVEMPGEVHRRIMDLDTPSPLAEALTRRYGGRKFEPEGLGVPGGGTIVRGARTQPYDLLYPDGARYGLSEADVRRLVGTGREGKSAYATMQARLGSSPAVAREMREKEGVSGLSYANGRVRQRDTEDFEDARRPNYIVFPGEEGALRIIERFKRGGYVK